jgi:AcrR family transcriptional regulator
MGRKPKHAGRDPTRERILSAALDVFSELGYEGASLRVIGKRARLNPAAVNYYFETKQRMWVAAVEHLTRPLLGVVVSAIAPGRPARESLRAFLGGLFDTFVADPRPARLFMWGALQAGQLDLERALSMYRPIIDVGAGYFEAAQRTGQLPTEIDIRIVLPQLFGMFIYTLIDREGHRMQFGADLSDPALAARVRATLLAGAERLLGLDRPVKRSRGRSGTRA